ncbi:UvrD-helicase domain-containing protein [Clostridiaceae bacterium HSG29]|nr:UvrD-helicase domain-containing protein [Clostridiaceae bacterium HSG29]
MSLKTISQENIQLEIEIQDSINSKIDSNECMVFDSGAGAGKTYALTESLKYVLKTHGRRLVQHGQQVICITYTNVATEELKDRLGQSNLVLISTIHERMWNLIQRHQKELVIIHHEKLLEKVEILKDNIESDSYIKYNELQPNKKEEFTEVIIQLKSEFYRCYNMKSSEFRSEFGAYVSEFRELLHNIGIFKKLVSAIYRIDSYNNTIVQIDEGNPGYRKLQYTARVNNDRLEKMQISHDTLLEYSYKMFEKYEILRRLVIDKYPYIFVDEYQDTNPFVVGIMNKISQTSQRVRHPFFVGYFGDAAQNIYEEGVGSLLYEKHIGLVKIVKEFNRRSSSEVIDVINRIRSDDIKQSSIFSDSNCGSVEFYIGSREQVPQILDSCKNDWSIDNTNRLHCLVLTNKVVATRIGLPGLYDLVKRMPRYSIGKGYEKINTELLSNDLSKLGYAQRAIFELVNFFINVNDNQCQIIDLIPKKILKKVNISQLRNLITNLNTMEFEDFGGYLEELIRIHDNFELDIYKEVISSLFPEGTVSIESLKNIIKRNWSVSNTDEELDEIELLIEKMFCLSMDEYNNWHKLICNKQKSDIVYHTYHGTKGLEFNNVLIIMEKRFGIDSNYFNKFFGNYQQRHNLEDQEKMKYNSVRNLIYFSCSRAIKNLRIFYVDDIQPIKNSVEEIFGEIISLNSIDM